ncbi:MAG: CDP-alcohol phosphatidyltransferase family protein [Anaerolineae bacterium]|nr:CDP-alcohol phosphatidyltransferase family protein [Anaerolineae bacterium]
MSRVRLLADGLTAFRFVIALYLLWLGVTGGPAALPTAAIALVLAWASDLADGPLARLDKEGSPSWIGQRDLEVDCSVAIGVLGYLTFSGYISWLAGVGYLLLSAALLWYFRSVHLAWALEAPPYFCLLWVALRDARFQGILAVLWILFTVVITWPRFPRTTVPAFLEGMRNLTRRDEEGEDNHRTPKR